MNIRISSAVRLFCTCIVGGVDGENVLFPSAQLCGVVLPDAVNIDRVDVAQRTEQPFFTELAWYSSTKCIMPFRTEARNESGLPSHAATISRIVSQ